MPVQSKSVAIIGLGNVGSHLTGNLARSGHVGRVILVDHDHYEEKNVASQEILQSGVGEPKVRIQSNRMRQIAPNLDIEEYVARLEAVPLGRLRADVIVSALDSRTSRRRLCQAACRLGVPFVDGAVDASGLLVRVAVYSPGPNRPCLECSWDDAEYAAQEQEYPCGTKGAMVAATDAPASLGAITAGMQATECEKLLAGRTDEAAIGHEVMMDLRHHTHYLTRLPLNPACRFDHQTWVIEPLPGRLSQITLIQLFERLEEHCGPGLAIGVEGHRFVGRQFCIHCNKLSMRPITLIRGQFRQYGCATCGQETVIRGLEKSEWLELSKLTNRDCIRSLADVGFQQGDVLTVRNHSESWHFELTGTPMNTDGVVLAASTAHKGSQ